MFTHNTTGTWYSYIQFTSENILSSPLKANKNKANTANDMFITKSPVPKQWLKPSWLSASRSKFLGSEAWSTFLIPLMRSGSSVWSTDHHFYLLVRSLNQHTTYERSSDTSHSLRMALGAAIHNSVKELYSESIIFDILWLLPFLIKGTKIWLTKSILKWLRNLTVALCIQGRHLLPTKSIHLGVHKVWHL